MQGKSFPSPISTSPPSSGAENPIQPFISHRDNHTCVVEHLCQDTQVHIPRRGHETYIFSHNAKQLVLRQRTPGPRILALIHHCETRPHTQRHAIIPLLCAKIPHPLSSTSNTISLQARHDNLSYTTAKSPHNDSRNQVPSGRHLLPGLLPCL